MRISSKLIYQQSITRLLQQQSLVAKLQQKASTGKEILTPSDDPAGMTQVLISRQVIAQFDRYASNIIIAEQRNQQEEITLNAVSNVLQRIKELAIQANSGIQTAETRLAISSELKERLAELLDLANTKDAKGDYLFSGFKGRTKAFVQSDNQFIYNGDQGKQQVQIGASRRVVTADSGFDVFQKVPNGNGFFQVNINPANKGSGVINAGSLVDRSAFTSNQFKIQFTSESTFDVINVTNSEVILSDQPYVEDQAITFNGIETSIKGSPQTGDEFLIDPSESQDIFTTVKNFINAMNHSQFNKTEQASLDQKMNNTIDNLDQALQHILTIHTGVGARLSSIDSVKDENLSAKTQMEITLSQIENADLTSTLILLRQQLLALEATRTSFSTVNNKTLLDFL